MPAAPATTESTTAPSGLSSLPGALGCGCLAIVAAVLAVLVPLAWNNRGGADFPRVAREDMADRAFGASREAYDVLGFDRTVEPGARDRGVGTENAFDSGPCYDGGFLGMEDKVVEGAYRMHHAWALNHVPADQAGSGLRRLRQRLEDRGWKINSYREGGEADEWSLYVERADGDERMSFNWDPGRGYFTGGSTVPCAYDPHRGTGDAEWAADEPSPPSLGPAAAHPK
ncbi:hypothetical protein STENM36S_07207 [Streptomyces tendae]